MENTLIIEAPAKINLTLDIKSKRPDGYHEIETVMHQIDLMDRVFIKSVKKGIKLETDSSLIPNNEENLAYRAAALVLREYGSGEGIEIFIEKNIPVGAGLAGGSTDAAAVLLGINEIYNYNIPQAILMKMAGEIGSDVPFCLLGRSLVVKEGKPWLRNMLVRMGATALARGRGEILIPLKSAVSLIMVLVKPDFQLSTAEVYKEFDFKKVNRFPDTSTFLDAWDKCDIISIASNLENVLESVSIKKYPQIYVIKEELIRMGALNAVMSGSGPSVFGIFREKEKACKAVEMLKRRYEEVYLGLSYIRGE